MLSRIQERLADRYLVDRELGRGGMATVYLATDLKHRRQVAIKVLRPELSLILGVERFLKEIETTAALQHPHILPLFDSGQIDGTAFYVMPFVDGQSLRDRLNREKQLPIDETIRIGGEIAGALDYAHRRGVVHRDIKPENILLQDGKALVADFGIALAFHSAGGSRLTETGLSLGTPQYMSPEQAAGDRELDGRSDIYSLASVIYEMIAGQPPFTGPTAQTILARLMADTPEPLPKLRPSVPRALAAAVECGLQKIPADRFASGAAFGEVLAGSGSVPPTLGGGGVRPGRASRWLPWVVTATALAVAGWGMLRGNPAAPHRARLVASIEPPPGRQFGFQYSLALSPDESKLAFVAIDSVGATSLWIHSFDSATARPLPGTDGAKTPVWSPDGRSLAYFAGGSLWLLRLDGSAAQAICAVPFPGGATWSRGRLLFGSGAAVQVANLEAKQCSELSRPDIPGEVVTHPVDLGNGSVLVPKTPRGGLWRIGSTGRNPILVNPDIDDAVLALPDVLVAGAIGGDELRYQRIDSQTGLARGAAGPIARHAAAYAGRPSFTAGPNRFVYVENLGSGNATIAEFSRTGSIVDPTRGPADRYSIAVGRTGSMLFTGSDDGPLWVHNLATDVGVRLDGTIGGYPTPSPGDTAVAYWRWGYSTPSTRVPCELHVFHLARRRDSTLLRDCVRPASWSPDGSNLLVMRGGLAWVKDTTSVVSVWRLSIQDGRLTRVSPDGVDARDPSYSPNGRWMAMSSDPTGTFEVYVQPSSGDGPPIRVSRLGGRWPRVRGDGRELFWVGSDGWVYAVAVEPLSGRVEGSPGRLLKLPFWHPSLFTDVSVEFDAAPSGERFFKVGRDTQSRAVLIENWLP